MQQTSTYPYLFGDPPTPRSYTLSLTTLFRSRRPRPPGHSRQPGCPPRASSGGERRRLGARLDTTLGRAPGHLCEQDRKSTRLNSSHMSISYAVFCLKKKKKLKIAYTVHQIQT